jgi:hypothetical protein
MLKKIWHFSARRALLTYMNPKGGECMSILSKSISLSIPALIVCVSIAHAEPTTQFLRYDRDANGEVSETEFINGYQTTDAAAVFRELDTDDNGGLDAREFAKLTEENTDSHEIPEDQKSWAQ